MKLSKNLVVSFFCIIFVLRNKNNKNYETVHFTSSTS